jgi:hypothetical protein
MIAIIDIMPKSRAYKLRIKVEDLEVEHDVVAVVNNLRSAPVVTFVCQKVKTNGSADKLLIGTNCRS